MLQHVSIQGQSRREQVQRVITNDVVVILEVSQHFLVVALAMTKVEAIFNFDRIPGPVQCRGFSQQGSSTAVE